MLTRFASGRADLRWRVATRDPRSAESNMLELLNGFVVELRNAGLPVSLTENLDAMEAVQHIPVDDREAFKYALGATLVKNNSHWRAFETVFEVYFSLRGPEYRLARRRRGRARRAVAGDAGAGRAGRRARRRRRRARRPDRRGDRPPADAGAARRRPGDDAGDGPPVGAALRRDGAGAPGRRHVLPVPHAAQPRPRRAAREADGGVTRRRSTAS